MYCIQWRGKEHQCEILTRANSKPGRKTIVSDEHDPRSYGLVQFETEETARNATEKSNGNKVFVGHFMNRRERLEQLGDKTKKCKHVYIKNFSEEIDDEKLKLWFEQFGKIIAAKVMTGYDGKGRGFGFVSFEEPEAAEKAVTEMNGTEQDNTILYVGRAQKRAERQAELKDKFDRLKQEQMNRYQRVNLYVNNLDDSIDDERLRKELSQFGTITNAKVMVEGGRSKGFGYVCYSSPEEATKAVTEMNGRIIVAKPLYVALAQRKKDRKAHLASQYMQRLASIRLHSQQMGQVFQPGGGAGYFVPTMNPGAARANYFAPTQIPQMRAGPRWQTVRPTGQSGGRPTTINARPITGQSKDQTRPGMTMPQSSMSVIPQQPQAPTMSESAGPRYSQYQNNRSQPPSQTIVVAGQDALTVSMLAAASPQEQKQMLGARLFPLIQRVYPDLAGKITDMLLDIESSELLHILDSPESLKAKVEEAVVVLQVHQAKEAAAQTP